MALTKAQVREILSAAGIASDKMDGAVESILDGHITSINALREDIARYKTEAEKLPGVQKELDDLKKVASGADDYKTKYEKEHSDFEAYKQDIQKKEVLAEKQKLYRKALKAANVDERRWDSILKVTDLEGLKVKDGKFTDEDGVKKTITDTWGDFVVKSKTEPSGDPATPPANNGNGGQVSRAAQLQKQYVDGLYGVQKTDK